MDNNNKIDRETWRQIIQVAIAILTVISGMFFEAKAQVMSALFGM